MSTLELVLLTHEYPFGVESEPFLETELPTLTEHFARVLVLPSRERPTLRPLPPRVELVRMPWLRQPSYVDRLAALASPLGLVLLQGAAQEVLRHRRDARVYLDELARNLLKLRDLSALVRQRGLHRAVFYDYWFANSTLALALCRRSEQIGTAVARAHGFDVFEEQSGAVAAAFRDFKALWLDAVFPTSDAAERHLAVRLHSRPYKLAVHRLGVRAPERVASAPTRDAPPLIATCALLHPLKRITLVPEVLSRLGRPVRWVHIGDGPERARVEASARRHLPEGSWRLLGQISNPAVLDFYAENSVSVLLSLSSSEGLPVTMMEAQSQGVPIVACDVGGVSEIVDERTGVLLNAHASVDELARGLGPALDPDRFDREEIRARWRERYDADTNYTRFAEALLAMAERDRRSDRVSSR